MEGKFVSFLYLLNRERERERERDWLIISGFENWQEEMVESNSTSSIFYFQKNY